MVNVDETDSVQLGVDAEGHPVVIEPYGLTGDSPVIGWRLLADDTDWEHPLPSGIHLSIDVAHTIISALREYISREESK